jgi:hypothetical protein
VIHADDEQMLLALLITAGSVALLAAMGWLTDQLLGGQAHDWARRVTQKHDDS